MQEISDDIEQQMSRIKKKLFDPNDPKNSDALANKLTGLSPVEILQRLFGYCEKFFQGNIKTTITEFVRICTSDKPSRKLFQLALHHACYDLVKPPEDFQKSKTSTVHSVDTRSTKEMTDENPSSMTPKEGNKQIFIICIKKLFELSSLLFQG